jgi:alpha-L-fucosidase
MKHKLFLKLACIVMLSSCNSTKVAPPQPYGALPTERQLAWHEMEMYNMIEFNQNNALDIHWGWGNESPELVNPVDFDAEEIVLLAKKIGSKGFLINAKHHGGFCMWPTKTTDYNISRSPWKNGKGDWVGEWAEACRKHGLKLGLYLSPWDRNAACFGTPEYLKMYKEQLTELCTNYGELFTLWFDGAPGSGGSGYYGGANEYRGGFIEYYDWENIYAIVRELQPNAVIFNDPGPDIRWVGNEDGYAGRYNKTCWATLFPEGNWNMRPRPNSDGERIKMLNEGQRNGKYWIPAECDFSLKSRFAYHTTDSLTTKSPQKLFDIYLASVGLGQGFDMCLPLTPKGVMEWRDVKSLEAFADLMDKTFSENLIKGAHLMPSNVRGNATKYYGTAKLIDNDRYSYWATDDSVTNASVIIELPKKQDFNLVKVRENIKLGQRLDSMKVDNWVDGEWKEVAEATSVGACRIIRLDNDLDTDKIRIRFFAPVALAISEVSLFKEPENLEMPKISRTKDGMVTIKTDRPAFAIRYTTDGSEPLFTSQEYEAPFLFDKQGVIRSAVFTSEKTHGEIASITFDQCKKDWKIISPTKSGVNNMIDDNVESYFHTYDANNQNKFVPDEIIVDMGAVIPVFEIIYTPRQDMHRNVDGVIETYEVYLSENRVKWDLVSTGTFQNIRQSLVPQEIKLMKPYPSRYLKLVVTSVLEKNFMSIAEIGVRTSE